MRALARIVSTALGCRRMLDAFLANLLPFAGLFICLAPTSDGNPRSPIAFLARALSPLVTEATSVRAPSGH